MEEGPSWPWSYGSWIYNYLCNRCLSPLMLWVWIPLRATCTTLSDKVCQRLVAGRWFSPVFSTNKTDRHDITEILLKVALNQTTKPNKWKRKNDRTLWFTLLTWYVYMCVYTISHSYDKSYHYDYNRHNTEIYGI